MREWDICLNEVIRAQEAIKFIQIAIPTARMQIARGERESMNANMQMRKCILVYSNVSDV